MRTTLVSVLVILGQWGMPAYAQLQAGAQATPGATVTGGYVSHPLAKRLFFFMPDAKNMGRSVARVTPAQKPGHEFQPNYHVRPVAQSAGFPNLKFYPTGMRPVESQPPQDFRKLLRPRNSRLFFFTKQ